MRDPFNKLFYLAIPKNASTMIRDELLKMGWFHELLDEHPVVESDQKIIVVLRDPAQRWISGITEFLVLYYPEFDQLSEDMLHLICTHITFDDHTEKQIYFLNSLITSRCVFFRFSPDLGREIAHFLETRKIKNNFAEAPVVYSAASSDQHMHFKNQITQFLQKNPKYLAGIMKHYKDDYDFIRQVQFYGTY